MSDRLRIFKPYEIGIGTSCDVRSSAFEVMLSHDRSKTLSFKPYLAQRPFIR